MPRGVLVRNAALVDHPVAFHAALCILLFVAWYANNFLITWYETLVSNWLQADFTAEALLVPLLALVLVLFHSCSKQSTASITTSSEVVVVAVGAVQLLVLTSERVIDERNLTIAALEATLMPMTVFVRQIL